MESPHILPLAPQILTPKHLRPPWPTSNPIFNLHRPSPSHVSHRRSETPEPDLLLLRPKQQDQNRDALEPEQSEAARCRRRLGSVLAGLRPVCEKDRAGEVGSGGFDRLRRGQRRIRDEGLG